MQITYHFFSIEGIKRVFRFFLQYHANNKQDFLFHGGSLYTHNIYRVFRNQILGRYSVAHYSQPCNNLRCFIILYQTLIPF